MNHPFFDSGRYPSHRPEAQALLNVLTNTVPASARIKLLYDQSGANLTPLTDSLPPKLMWNEALQNLTSAGALKGLLSQVQQEFKNNATIQQVINDVINAQPSADHDITDALRAILELLNKDPDYNYLLRRFTAILEQISLLSDYKTLHDGLHEIQYSFYQNIIGSTKIVMDDKYAKNDLMRYLRDYRRVISDMQDAAKRKRVETIEDQWIMQLDQAGNDLEDGINKSDKNQINNATESINQVIGIQPTIVNRKLYSAVYAYNGNLPELTTLMNKVSGRVKAIAQESEVGERLEKGIQHLTKLNGDLTNLIAEHNTWQDVDNQLRTLPDLLDAGVSVFNKRWQALRKRIEPFYTSKEDASSVLFRSSARLKQADDLLEAAIATNDTVGVRKEFENYCSQASDRFFYVDKSVMQLCGELSLIRKELDFDEG